MEIEYWWLLALPLFFAMGWLAARIDIKHLLTESRALPRSYFKGLNFLLNEQPDKAIEALNGQDLKGRPLTVSQAREREPRRERPYGGGGGGRGHRDE